MDYKERYDNVVEVVHMELAGKYVLDKINDVPYILHVPPTYEKLQKYSLLGKAYFN